MTVRSIPRARDRPRDRVGTERHGVPGPEGSPGKSQWAEVNQALTELAVELRGARAVLDDDRWTYRCLRARANSIEGGTTEILKNIVAERVLGLPRMR
jgi:alkylation response protein AidB-like acyl-CoA dehydrogenase